MYTFASAPKGYVDQQGVVHEYGPSAMNWQMSAPGLTGRRRNPLGLKGRWETDENGFMRYVPDATDAIFAVASAVGGAAGIYHGYKRTGKVWPAIGYGALGLFLPIIGIPVFFIQGFGKKKGRR